MLKLKFSDNPRQKDTINDIILAQEKKMCVIYRLDFIFSKTHVTQLMVLKINFCHRDIRSANSNFITCQEVEK